MAPSTNRSLMITLLTAALAAMALSYLGWQQSEQNAMLQSLADDQQAHQAQVEQLMADNRQSELDLADARANVTELKKTREKLLDEVEAMKRDHRATKAEKQALEEEYDAVSAQLKEALDAVAALATELDDADEQLARVTEERDHALNEGDRHRKAAETERITSDAEYQACIEQGGVFRADVKACFADVHEALRKLDTRIATSLDKGLVPFVKTLGRGAQPAQHQAVIRGRTVIDLGDPTLRDRVAQD